MNNNENKNLTEKKFPTTDAKNALEGALKGIPKSFLLKVFFSIFLVFTCILKYFYKDSGKASRKS